MDAKLKTILKNLPAKKVRSHLEPYRELIREMRRRRRSYREIIQVLHDKCDVQISVSTLHDFVRLRSRSSKQISSARFVAIQSTKARKGSAALSRNTERVLVTQKSGKEDESHAGIYRGSQVASANLPLRRTSFQYDPDEPLRLPNKY